MPLAPFWIALALFVGTVALRLPFASQTLNHWDSVNHALALTDYDIAVHRPQPPGYILYIGVARLVNLVLPDPQTALVTVSIMASALAVALMFLLGARMGSTRAGLVAAVLLMTNPAFWFDSEVALPYVVEGCLSIALALLFYSGLEGERRWLPVAAVVWAIAIGMRQQLALFFAPLVVYAYWKQSWRVRIESGLWFTLVCLLWFVPLVASAGGVSRYVQLVRNLNAEFSSEYVLAGSGGIRALWRNAYRLLGAVLYALNLTLIPLTLDAVGVLRARAWRGVLDDRRVRFVLLWTWPSVVFYLLVHMGSPGLIYVFMPGLVLAAAFTLEQLAAARQGLGLGLIGLCCAANAVLFLLTPPDLFLRQSIRVLNYSSMMQHDLYIRSRVSAIENQFDPETTVILASDWRFAEYYLPEYRVIFFAPEDKLTPVILARGRKDAYTTPADPVLAAEPFQTVVFFDLPARQFLHGEVKPECIALADGECLGYVLLNEQAVSFQTDGIHLARQ